MILNPIVSFSQQWNRAFLLSAVIRVSLDPLFFYTLVVNEDRKCLFLDRNLGIAATVLRSVVDCFYLIYVACRLFTEFIHAYSRGHARQHDQKRKYLLSWFFLFDIIAVLPMPQVVLLRIIPTMKGSNFLYAMGILKFVLVFQYFPRILRVYRLLKRDEITSGILPEAAWAKVKFNLFLYFIAGHVVGSLWYFLAIERESTCWHEACGNNVDCVGGSFYCDNSLGNYTFLNDVCPISSPNAELFDFGIYLYALQSGVVRMKNFHQKFFHCFRWGLQNLSSYGQNLQPSTDIWENFFAVFILISGLLPFLFLIGNSVQTYLQSTTTRLEETTVKRRDAEQRMSQRLLPSDLRDQIRRYEQDKWQETRGVDEENLLRNLPKYFRRDIKRHLCLDLLKKVPMFEKMDEQMLDAMCDRLKPVLYTENSYLVREGDPVDEMLFIKRGELLTTTTNGGRSGFFNSENPEAGDFCGEELLTWALDPNSSSIMLPTSTRTVEALSEVEAFALGADDLKFLASQFRRLHSKQLRHTFRFYSQQWRTWAACFIQAAWRRYRKKKLEESLSQQENRLQDALANSGGKVQSFHAKVYASRFVANALHSIRHKHAPEAMAPERVLPMPLQKPSEPDFTAEER